MVEAAAVELERKSERRRDKVGKVRIMFPFLSGIALCQFTEAGHLRGLPLKMELFLDVDILRGPPLLTNF